MIRYLCNNITTSCFIRSAIGKMLSITVAEWSVTRVGCRIMRDHGVNKVISFTMRFRIEKIDIKVTHQKYFNLFSLEIFYMVWVI